MHFILQKEEGSLDMDTEIVKREIEKQKYVHTYDEISLSCMKGTETVKGKASQYTESGNAIYKKGGQPRVIPVGSIDFVTAYLKEQGVLQLCPIEVPKCLQRPKYLKRDYQIVAYEFLPSHGTYFVKRADKLKDFSFCGDIDVLRNWKEEINLVPGLYQVSEAVKILSEWRVFVCRDTVINCIQYEGDPLVFPDSGSIYQMIAEINRDRILNHAKLPLSYTLDIAVIENRGTAVLELHPWVSVGLYGYLFGSDLLYAYQDGLAYYLNSNVPTNQCNVRWEKEN